MQFAKPPKRDASPSRLLASKIFICLLPLHESLSLRLRENSGGGPASKAAGRLLCELRSALLQNHVVMLTNGAAWDTTEPIG